LRQKDGEALGALGVKVIHQSTDFLFGLASNARRADSPALTAV